MWVTIHKINKYNNKVYSNQANRIVYRARQKYVTQTTKTVVYRIRHDYTRPTTDIIILMYLEYIINLQLEKLHLFYAYQN